MVLLLPFAFLAGVVTVMSPCILPLLPIILASAFGNSRWRPLGVVLGLVVSFAFFTLALTSLVTLLGIPADALRLGGAIIIGLFGLVMVVPTLNHRFEGLTRRLSGFGSIVPVGGDFWGGAPVGGSLGLVWAPCAGPILASVTTLVATNRISWEAVVVTLTYALGVGTPMLLIAYGGRRIVRRVDWLSWRAATLQRAFGVVMIAFALTFFTGWDRTVQTALVQSVPPEWTNTLTSFEQLPAVRDALNALKGRESASPSPIAPAPAKQGPAADLSDLGPAAEFVGISGWLNGEPATLASLRGKVVLVDFWTYSCINCIRTLPYLNDWHAKYKDAGLVIVGVHTPEFAFERSRANVAKAIQQHGIGYLVAQDNDYATWEAYDNLYWPAKYLVDARGRLRYAHFGEGKYGETESVIRTLLAEAGREATTNASEMKDYALVGGRTPELYLGAARQANLASPERFVGGQALSFSLPSNLPRDRFAFAGEWTIEEEYARPAAGARLDLQFYADDVYVVLVPGEQPDEVEVLLDGRPLDASTAGADSVRSLVEVAEPRLYHLVNLRGSPGEHRLSLLFRHGGSGAYAFTFG